MMDGQVNYNNIGPVGCDGQESDDETLVGNIHVQGLFDVGDDDLEEPDGQRNSLSLDDDGGSHFESSVHSNAVQGPTSHDTHDDNDVLFNPAQRLNFDSEEDDEQYDDEMPAGSSLENDNSSGDGEYLSHRPLVNGSDVAEEHPHRGASDQAQNIRIIEGHDSSLIDDDSLNFGINFLQPQQVQMGLVSPVQSGNMQVRMDDVGHNLYDSLERVDGESLFGNNNEHLLENHTSNYFRSSIPLIVANPQGSDTDAIWAQDDNSDHGSYLSHSQPQFHGQSRPSLDNQGRNLSPPRNFKSDASLLHVSQKRSSDGNFAIDGNLGVPVDVRNPMDDSTDVLSLELSEEGLVHNTQMYAQPVATGVLIGAVGDMSNSRGEPLIHYQPQYHDEDEGGQAHAISNQIGLDGNLANVGNNQTQPPKNLARNLSHASVDLHHSSHSNGDGSDAYSDERQAGAGSSSSARDQNQSAGGHRPVAAMRRTASMKLETQRPAVQGSASSGGNKSTMGNPRPGRPASQNRKVVPASSARVNMTGGDSSKISGGARKKMVNEGNRVNLRASSSAHSQMRQTNNSSGMSPLTSRTNSHSSLASNASTNSRVSGVGKESKQHHQHPPRGSGNSGVENNFVVYNRDGPGHQPEQYNPACQPQSSGATNANSGLAPNQSQSFEKLRSNAALGSQHMLRPSQSFNKAFSVSASNVQYQNDTNIPLEYSQGQAKPAHQSSALPSAQFLSRPHLQQQYHLHETNHPTPQTLHHRSLQQHQYSSHQLDYERVPPTAACGHGVSPTGSDSSRHSHTREPVITQMEALKRQGQRLSPNEMASTQKGQLENDIQGMEDMRSHLQNMLKIGADLSVDTGQYEQSEIGADLIHGDPVNRQLHFDTDSGSYVGGSHHHGHEDMSDILENFPAFSSKIFSDFSAPPSRNEATVHGEIQYLRESLEKERYRRKHCEEQIQKLNTKLLEVQQQLAVAVSTDKRKDVMIEQLDKQLAKVVEGWKKRESEKDEFMKVLSQEKEQIEETLHKQQKMISNFEHDLAQTVTELRTEKEHSAHTIAHLKEELNESKQMKEKAEAERETMTAEWDQLKASHELAEKIGQQAQEQLIKEQENWDRKEKELSAKLAETKDENQRSLNMEKVKLEEQKKKREEAEAQSSELKTELKRVVLDMEQLLREKESQDVEVTIIKAKCESSQRKLETELHAQMEKEISDQATEFHNRMESSMKEISERHRQQVTELHARHQEDTERQMMTFNEDREKKEDEYRRRLTEMEEKLQDMRTENSTLKQSKLKLESQRMEILTKLQFMMQSQWNEAVSLLVSTPQKKSLNSSFMSGQSGGQMASALAVTDGNTSLTSLNLVSGVHPSATSCSIGLSSDQGGPATLAALSPPRDSVSESKMEENAREEDTRMERVEEYLHGLSESRSSHLHVDHLTHSHGRNDSTHTDHLTHSHGCHDSTQSVEDVHDKKHVRLNPSPGARVNDFISGQSGRTLMTTGHHTVDMPGHGSQNNYHTTDRQAHGSDVNYHTANAGHRPEVNCHTTEAGHRPEVKYQAIAMRSPQQSSSRHSANNINIYHPESSKMTSSPGTDQWSLSQISHQVGRSGVSTSVSPSRLTSSFSHLMESPVKRNRGRPLSGADCLNDSLSPPVKQTAERDHSDIRSDTSVLQEAHRMHYSNLSDRMESHENRQEELQHYVRMLLSKAPGSACSEPERDFQSESLLESSRDLTVDIDLNDTAQAMELNTQLNRIQQLRESQGLQHRIPPGIHPGSIESNQPSASQSMEAQHSQMSDSQARSQMSDNGVINSQGLSEISHLLSVYREQWEMDPDRAGQENLAGQLMTALKGMASGIGNTDKGKTEERNSSQQSSKPSKPRKVRNSLQTSQSTNDVSSVSERSSNGSRPGVKKDRKKPGGVWK